MKYQFPVWDAWRLLLAKLQFLLDLLKLLDEVFSFDYLLKAHAVEYAEANLPMRLAILLREVASVNAVLLLEGHVAIQRIQL